MDDRQFDTLARSVGRVRSRRGALKLLASGGLAALSFKAASPAFAQSTCIPSKEACQTTDQCCRGACVDSICDSTCSEVDAICETDLDCCSSLACKVVGGTPRCRPANCVAQAGACTNDADCCEGSCADGVCVLTSATAEPTSQPTEASTEEPTTQPTEAPPDEPTEAPTEAAAQSTDAAPAAESTQDPGLGSAPDVAPTTSAAVTLPSTGSPSSPSDRTPVEAAGGLAAAGIAMVAAFRMRGRKTAEKD